MLEFFNEHFEFIYNVIFTFDYAISYSYNLFTLELSELYDVINGVSSVVSNTFVLYQPLVIRFVDLGVANDIIVTSLQVVFAPIDFLFDSIPLWAAMFMAYVIYGLVFGFVNKMLGFLRGIS